MTSATRKTIAALVFSAAGLAFTLSNEGFVPNAAIPVPGDRPTVGYGSTFRDDGSPVRLGDTITEPRAREKAKREIRQKYEAGLQVCAGDLELTQGEYDSLVDAAYNLGTKTVCNSGMVRNFSSGNYAAACGYYLEYKFSQKRDCSLPKNKKVCGGVWERRLKEKAMCES